MSRHPHLHNPLEYLYEEIPAEKMADARAHLAECPECLRAVKTIRETVKTYRACARATAPDGFKDKVMQQAAEMDRNRKAQNGGELSVIPPQASAAPPDYLPAVIHKEIEQFESLRRFRWRTWFFHPAWTVAASVVFACALLIHMSPRRNLWFDAPRDAQSFGKTSMPQVRNSAASGLTADSKYTVNAEPVLPPESRARFVPPPPMTPPMTREPAPPAPQIPAASPAAALPLPPEGAPRAIGEARVPGSPPSAQSFGMPSADALSSFRDKDGEHPSPGGVSGPDVFDDLPDSSASHAFKAEQDPVIVGFHHGEPPSIIARPEPVNRERLILNLTFLAGMQLGQKEFSEAARTIELLMPLHPEKASELFRILDGMTQAQEPMIVSGSAPEAARHETTPDGAPAASRMTDGPESGPPPEGERNGAEEGRPADGPQIPLSESAQGGGEPLNPSTDDKSTGASPHAVAGKNESASLVADPDRQEEEKEEEDSPPTEPEEKSASPAVLDDLPDEAVVQDDPIATESPETHETGSGDVPSSAPEAPPPALPADEETAVSPISPTPKTSETVAESDSGVPPFREESPDVPNSSTTEPGPTPPPLFQTQPRKPRPFSTDPYIRGD